MPSLQTVVSRDVWDSFVLEHAGHPLQLWGWGAAKALHGWSVVRVLVRDDDAAGAVVGGAQILLRKVPGLGNFAYIPRGPVLVAGADLNRVLDVLTDHVKESHRAFAFSIEPHATQPLGLSAGWVRAENTILAPETVILDLTRSESELMGAMAKKTRQYIRKSGGLVEIVQASTLAEVEVCLDLYQETADRAGFNIHTREYYLDVYRELAEHAPLYMAMVEGAPVAFLWLAVSNAVSYELYGGMNEVGQHTRANYALKWHAITATKAMGLSEYDFGGMIEGGVSTFKKGWCEDVTHLVGTFDRPLSPLYPLWSKGVPLAQRTLRRLRGAHQ